MKGIIFSTPMVEAILAGRKTQTRREIKPQPKIKIDETWSCDTKPKSGFSSESAMRSMLPIYAPYKVGDVLYVKETYQHTEVLNIHPTDDTYGYVYKADGQPWEDFEGWKWKSPMFMPEKAARLFIVITGVKVERLQELSEEDAIAEGIEEFTKDGVGFKYGLNGWHWSINTGKPFMCYNRKIAYQSLWESLHDEESWKANPWVWAYTFEIYQP